MRFELAHHALQGSTKR